MLILTRRPQQRIVIDGRIEVVVLQVTGDSVRLGITAPREVEVHRHEVLAAITSENQRAMTTSASLAPGREALEQWQQVARPGQEDA